MPQELWTIIWSTIGTIVTAFIGWLTATGIAWLNKKIKGKDEAKWASAIYQMIMDAVQAIQQTFVDSLKKAGKFDAEAAAEARDRAIQIIKGQLTDKVKKYIIDNFGDIDNYLINQVEAMIWKLKSNRF